MSAMLLSQLVLGVVCGTFFSFLYPRNTQNYYDNQRLFFFLPSELTKK